MISDYITTVLADIAQLSGIRIQYFDDNGKNLCLGSQIDTPPILQTFIKSTFQRFPISDYLSKGYACHLCLQIGLETLYLPISQTSYCEVGPFLSKFFSIDEVLSRLTAYDVSPSPALIDFFINDLPICSSRKIESILRMLCNVLDLHISEPVAFFSDTSIKKVATESILAENIEERKRIVRRAEKLSSFLSTLAEGDYLKCLQFISDSRQYQIGDRYSHIPLKNECVKSIYHAALFSFVASSSGVSPVNADIEFCNFIRKISKLSTVEEVVQENFKMLQSFCELIQQENSPYSSLVQRIIHYLSFHVNAPLDIDDLCQAMELPRNKCEAAFKKECGVSITKYHQDIRLKQAIELLNNKALSISQIANQVGFGDQNYFARVFKKTTAVLQASTVKH